LEICEKFSFLLFLTNFGLFGLRNGFSKTKISPFIFPAKKRFPAESAEIRGCFETHSVRAFNFVFEYNSSIGHILIVRSALNEAKVWLERKSREFMLSRCAWSCRSCVT